MLRYKADVRTILFVILYFLLTILAWVWFYKMDWYLVMLIMMALCFSSFICAIIVHNVVHCPVFKKRWLNIFFQIVLSFTYGHSVSMFVAGHNMSHHKNLATRKDIARTSKMRFKWNLLNQALFFFWTANSILKTEYSWSGKMYRKKPRWFYQYVMELGLLYGVKLGLLLIDYQAALLLVFLPHLFAQWGIVGTNYWQHDGCDTSHPYNHSRNFYNPVMNFFFLNNGFHGLHHNNPTLHWSKLPEVYAKEFRPCLHPNLDRNSLFAYLWESCIYPGKRLDYLGNPVVLRPGEEDKDQDWVKEVSIEDHAEDMGAIA